MSDQKERIRQDWGGYQPETQKALRFVASLAGEGTAKQVANAIAQEYTKPESTNKPVPQQKTLSEGDIRVLRLVSGERGHRDIDEAISLSGLNEDQFFQSIEALKQQGYIAGDVIFGYFRTKKPYPPKEKQKKSAAARHKAMTEADFEAIVDDWIAAHPHIYIDEKQRELMIRTHLMLQKVSPGWTL